MQFTVLHMDKGKGNSNGGLTKHIDRTQEPKNMPKNVDQNRTHLNIDLLEPTKSIDKMANERIKEGYKGKTAIRKDAVKTCKFILSGSHERMKELEKEGKIQEWALDNYDYFAERYGKENIVRATVHMDEKTPHMHLVLVPLTQEGKLSSRELFGGHRDEDKLKNLHTDYSNTIGLKYGLERGIETERTKSNDRVHTTTHDFYKHITENNLTAEEILKLPREESKELIKALLTEKGFELKKQVEKTMHKPKLNEYRREFNTSREITQGDRGEEKERGTTKQHDNREVNPTERGTNQSDKSINTEHNTRKRTHPTTRESRENDSRNDFGM